MRKRLAIKGHFTRGKEVIELLKMMGGENKFKDISFIAPYIFLYVDDGCFPEICWDYIGDDEPFNDEEFVLFTLEEFLERFPYKVGDEFCNPYDKITEMFWDEEDEIVYYKTEYSRDYVTTTDIMLDNYARIK